MSTVLQICIMQMTCMSNGKTNWQWQNNGIAREEQALLERSVEPLLSISMGRNHLESVLFNWNFTCRRQLISLCKCETIQIKGVMAEIAYSWLPVVRAWVETVLCAHIVFFDRIGSTCTVRDPNFPFSHATPQ